jgi:hypothetical protein
MPVQELLRIVAMGIRIHFLRLVGLVVLVGGCAKQNVATAPSSPPSTAVSTAPTNGEPSENLTRPFPELITTSVSGDSTLPVPSLIPPTEALQRLPQVRAGRGDPFTAVTSPVIVAANPAAAPQSVPGPLLPPPTLVQTVPLGGIPQPIPASVELPEQVVPPSVSAPVGNAPAPVALASAIEVTGVVQVGTQVSAIVQVPNEGSSRYVRSGDYLANGRVLVRRIEVTPNEEPRVILVQDGVEIIRTVGNAG